MEIVWRKVKGRDGAMHASIYSGRHGYIDTFRDEDETYTSVAARYSKDMCGSTTSFSGGTVKESLERLVATIDWQLENLEHQKEALQSLLASGEIDTAKQVEEVEGVRLCAM